MSVLVKPLNLKPVGYQQLAVSNAVAGVGLTVPRDAKYVDLEAETHDIRWRDDGVAPTASIGMILPSAVSIVLEYSGDLTAILFIRGGGADCILNATFYA